MKEHLFFFLQKYNGIEKKKKKKTDRHGPPLIFRSNTEPDFFYYGNFKLLIFFSVTMPVENEVIINYMSL